MAQTKKRQWILPEDTDTEESGGGVQNRTAAGGAGAEAAVHPVLRRLLAGRGVKSQEELEEFLSNRPQLTYDPFLMKDMETAAARILTAAERGELICVYGDYDADGVTSCSLLLTILGKLTERLMYYIPSRFEEGYGLNEEAVRSLWEKGVGLLVTVDCGSVSWKEVELAKELGMDVIVTDHHNINGSRAADCLLVNPKQEQCGYPCKVLCGCGVAFKLAQAIQRLMEKRGDGRLKRSDVTDTLDLVAVATIGDIVPLVGENRSLVKYGLNILNQGKRPGLRALAEGAGLKLGEIGSEQVAYIIVPHLNAAGRMISADKGVELLTDTEKGAAADRRRKESVEFLVENNKERKRVQEKTFGECRQIVTENHPEDLFQVIHAPQAHEGIAGIVAGKIKDVYFRPAIIVTPSGDGFLKGTGRSVEGIDLYALLSSHSDLFQRFGGHSGACGFLMKQDFLPELRRLLNEDVAALTGEEPDLLTERIRIEGVLSPADLTLKFLREADKIAPFGHMNPQPVFALRDVEIRKPYFMGDNRQHVRFQACRDGVTVNCILFQNAADYEEMLREGARADVAGCPGINVWNGVSKIQFVIRDIK